MTRAIYYKRKNGHSGATYYEGALGSRIYDILDGLERKMTALEGAIKDAHESDIERLENELDKVVTEYNKLMDGK
jgi:hypothetical protein